MNKRTRNLVVTLAIVLAFAAVLGATIIKSKAADNNGDKAGAYTATIYYKGFKTPYIHYKAGNGSWTSAPGKAMHSQTELGKYTHKYTIKLNSVTDKAVVCFNDGKNNWDNNNGQNYTFGEGIYGCENQTVETIDPESILKVTSFTSEVTDSMPINGNSYLKFEAAGGCAPYTYDVGSIFEGEEVMIEKDTTFNFAEFTPGQNRVYDVNSKLYVGKHVLFVDVKDAAGNVARKTLSPIDVKGLTITSMDSDLASPQLVGTRIHLSVNVENEATYRYNSRKFTISKDGQTPTTLSAYYQIYSTDWTPTEPGNYTITYFIRDNLGQTATKSIDFQIVDVISNNETTIYYSGYQTPYIHYRAGNGNWTTAPGIALSKSSDVEGYTHVITLNYQDANSIEACFNNGKEYWDNNKGKNYFFGTGCYTFRDGKITQIEKPSKTLKINSVFADNAAPQVEGTNLFIRADVSNWSSESSIFSYSVTSPDGTTTKLSGTTPYNALWTPKAAGTYTLTLNVTDSKLGEDSASITYEVLAKDEAAVIYYTGYSSPYIHYQIGDGAWTKAPGKAMTASNSLAGYTHKIIIPLKGANKVTACFNDGNGNWQNNNGSNYTFHAGDNTINPTQIENK